MIKQRTGGYLVAGRPGGERVLGGQHRAADEDADEDEVAPVRVRTKLEADPTEPVARRHTARHNHGPDLYTTLFHQHMR